MSKLTRRSLFPLAAAGVAAAADGSQGATIQPDGSPGITIRICKRYGGWEALVPDWDSMNGMWQPGMAVPVKWMPIAEYLALIDEVYSA